MTIAGRPIPIGRADLWRFGASLVLAIILWGTVTAANNPERTKTFSAVDVTPANLDDSLLVVGVVPQISVRLTGPRSDITPITANDIKANVDLKSIHAAGEYNVKVNVATTGTMWKKVITPSIVHLVIDQSATKDFPVTVVVQGSPDSNQQVGATTPQVASVTVKGPASEVSEVSQVIASIDIANQTKDFTDAYTPVAVDATGNQLPNVTIDPGSIPVTVQITARGKRIAVITELDGEPAAGYDVIDRTINPSTVVVDGPADELTNLISVSTEPIEVSGATATLQKHVALVGLPADVKVIDPADGAVDVVVQIAQRGVRQPLPSQPVTVVNVGAGLTAEVSPGDVSVTVVASDAAIAKLTGTDVLVQVNAAGLGPGTYTLTPIVALPSSISWVSTDPTTVTVTIKPAGTPSASTPEPASTPLASPTSSP